MQLFSWLLIPILSHVVVVSVSGQCQPDEQALLLQLKNSLEYNTSYSTKLVTWNNSTDCCSWQGVNCTYGHVTSLDLSFEDITDGINGSSNLFSLQYLQRLNLAFNSLNSDAIPPELGKLTNLSYLNLSQTGFAGQIPGAISSLRRLVILDLSSYPWLYTVDGHEPLVLESPNLRMFVQNFTELTELYLDGVIISAQGKEWCQALSSSLPNLRVLSLSHSNISGPIDVSLLKLSGLSEIYLGDNNLSTTIPEFFGNFSNLTSLSFWDSSLFGEIPMVIFQLPMLQHVDLSYNELLQGSLLKFPLNASLRTLILSHTNVSGRIPDSIGNLKMLSRLALSYCSLTGEISSSIAGLKELVNLDLSDNNLTGAIPWVIFQLPMLQHVDLSLNKLLQGSLPKFPLNASLRTLILSVTNVSGRIPDSIGNLKMLSTLALSYCSLTGEISSSIAGLKELVYLDLSYNNLTGEISSSIAGLKELVYLDLSYNNLTGSIPSLFSLPSLWSIQLSNNQLSGKLDFSNFSSPLEMLDLSSNQLGGIIPMSVFELQGLEFLSLSYNNLSGHFNLSLAQQLKNLSFLDLSYNRLSVNVEGVPESSFPLLSTLKLASCKLMAIPLFLRGRSRLMELDLSNNQINGQIPNWLWRLESLRDLNLSRNHLISIGEPKPPGLRLEIFDVHNNLLQGQIPRIAASPRYLDFSENNFSSTIPDRIGDVLSSTSYFSVSGNKLSGSIPSSICNAELLVVLDLSNNSLSGDIPRCLTKMAEYLVVLNLRKNNFGGIIPDTFPESCKLQTLDLNGNSLRGKVPRSLANCADVEVVNLGNNLINDTFPCQLKAISWLRVLVLKSNQFFGPIGCEDRKGTWPRLQILDLASNNFSGNLPEDELRNWKAMMSNENEQSHLKHRFPALEATGLYYQDSITIASKGLEMELVKILTIFTAIDLSYNNLEGQIPDVVGKFNALHILNLSHNALSGPIPQSLGKMSEVESLDLSGNKLTGKIPDSLADLNFLSFLNLSNNFLEGSIPTGTQLQSFSEHSFENNKGLCGPPLNTRCPETSTEDRLADTATASGFEWNILSIEIGFIVGLMILLVPLYFCRRWRIWYSKLLDRVVYWLCPRLDQRN